MLKKLKTSRNRESGAALLLALIVTVGLIVLGSAYVAVVRSNSQLSLITYADVEAMHIAEAGIEFAIWEVAHGGTDFLAADGWTGITTKVKTDTISIPAGPVIGEYIVSVTYVGFNKYEILSRGFFPNQANTISDRTVKVLIEKETVFKQAMFALDGIDLAPSVYVDSYDTRLGVYGGANVSSAGDLITNSISNSTPYAASLGSSAVVNGDVTIGVGGDLLTAINMSPGSSITGTTGTLSKTNSPYAVSDISGLLPYQGALDIPANGTATISSSGEYDSITLGNHSTLIVDADVTLYLDGAMNFETHSTMIISPTATISLIINDTLAFSSFAQVVNLSCDPKQFTIYGTNNVTSFDLGSQGQFFGNVYMPNADCGVGPFTDYYGSIVAKSIFLASNVNFHFDKSLADDPSAPTFKKYVLRKWQGN